MFAFVLMCSESRSLVILRACRFFGSAAPSFSDQQLEYAVESCVDALDALAHTSTATEGQLRLSRKNENKNILVFEMRQTQVFFLFFFFSFFLFFFRHNGPASAAPCQEGHFWKRSETKKRIPRVAQKTQIRAALQELLESLPCWKMNTKFNTRI